MWSYHGAKTRVIDHYPSPGHDLIIEPFAGSARYSLKWFERDVILIDKYEIVVRIWRWLQKCSIGDILTLPRRMRQGQSLDDFSFDCEEARWLMGFLVTKGVESPRNVTTRWTTTERPNWLNHSLKRIADNLFRIRHWKIELGDYTSVKNHRATWFIDPPYEKMGMRYIHSSKCIDYSKLGRWCRSRRGQVIVCEGGDASWLPFRDLVVNNGRAGAFREMIWTDKSHKFARQTDLFKKEATHGR